MAARREMAAGQLTFSETGRVGAPSVKLTAPEAVSESTALPKLLDRKTLAAEMGLPRSAVDAVFRSLPVVALPGLRKPMVRREDVLRLLEESTFRDGERVR